MKGIFLYSFGREGTQPGELKHPRGICSDAEGFVLVADSDNSRIQIFRHDGQYVTHFGKQGLNSGEFKGLEGITVNPNGDVIVCDKENHRVQIL
jgi:DNA-binding beta-propeller fold protein YncE